MSIWHTFTEYTSAIIRCWMLSVDWARKQMLDFTSKIEHGEGDPNKTVKRHMWKAVERGTYKGDACWYFYFFKLVIRWVKGWEFCDQGIYTIPDTLAFLHLMNEKKALTGGQWIVLMSNLLFFSISASFTVHHVSSTRAFTSNYDETVSTLVCIQNTSLKI